VRLDNTYSVREAEEVARGHTINALLAANIEAGEGAIVAI
jgi:hypothetical protein